MSAHAIAHPVSHPPRRARLSLRSKGMLALVVLVAYVAGTAWYLVGQRRALDALGQQLESHQAMEALLAPSVNTLAHTLVQTQAILSSPGYTEGPNVRYSEIAASLDPLMSRLHKLQAADSSLAEDIAIMDGAVEAVRTEPSGRNLALARDAEQGLIANLNDIMAALQRRTDALAEGYERQQHLIQLTAIGTSLVGAAASAAVILVFFTRLARDIERLRARAAAIVSGYAGEPLRNHRHDEVGALIEAVNHMQVDLRHWERQQEISRQQRFHEEKMAAVGSMAAAIGHEVSNPMAAISGMAQFLIDESRGDGQKLAQLAQEFGRQILRQTERVTVIMRQLTTLTRTSSPEPELLDLNALVTTTCSFIGYDKRFRGIEFEHDLDRDLPAVFAVADHLTQIMMNLLINSADAMEQLPKEQGVSRIRLTTRVEGNEVRLSVADTGHGMTPEVQARAFEESFTTKPVGRGRGIGLFLCKTLIEQTGGRIALASIPGAGTTISLFLPLEAADQPKV